MKGQQRRAPGLDHLDALSDAELHALLGRIQGVLLDRPRDGTLAVEVVRDDEARLLALYRALPPARRPAALSTMERTVATGATAS